MLLNYSSIFRIRFKTWAWWNLIIACAIF